MGGGSESKKQLGKILLQQKLVSADELQELLDDQKRDPGARLASTAIRAGRLSMLDALRALSEQHGVPPVDLSAQVIPLSVLRLVPVEIAHERSVMPFRLEGEQLLLAMSSPQEQDVIDELEFVAAKKIQRFVALDHVIRNVIDYAYAQLAAGSEYYVGAHVTEAELAALGLPDLPRAPEPMIEAGAAAAPAPAVPPPPPPAGTLGEELDQAFGQRMLTSKPPVYAPPAADARVLLAVPDAAARAALARSVGDAGVTVVETDHGEKALSLIREQKPRVLVLDMALPGVHGLDICRRLRASPSYAELAIVVLADAFGGWRMARDVAVNYGIKHFFEQPLDESKLLRTVRLLLEGKQPSDEPPPMSPEAEQKWNGAMSAFERGDLDAAIAELEAGLAFEPNAFELHYHLGLLYGRREDLFLAIRALETALRVQSLHFAAIKNLAVVYQRAGLRHKAIDAWERAMAVAGDDETRANIREHMVSLL
jgi:DNA-binding response OmpR family regulator